MKKLLAAAVLLFSGSLYSEVYVVEAHKALGQDELKQLEKIEGVSSIKSFLPFGGDYLKRLYEVEIESLQALKLVQNNKLVKLVEADHEAELFEIRPNPKSEMFTQDMLYPFQWGLQNQEQIISAQTPSGGPEETKGVPGEDIDWKEEIEKIESNLRKEPVVAVIDMGIDVDHPELEGQIYKNEIECDEGQVQIGNREDRDKNGLPGDCHGWNFASTAPMYDAHPTDDKGHGTHVSGIIAAKRNNRVGISGVSDKIKILPIRVTGRVDETEDRNNLKYKAASRRIAKGIFYAVHRKVDVINLSLGWPKSMNTNYMKMAIRAAIQNNVLIVAAAGNNNSNASIYPCAYREVLCVGSIDAEGKVSRFSNYGGEVDILAPGDQIVSTIPTEFIPLKLNLQGYEIMSGTSQAAPFVSAAAALIKSIFPGLPNHEVQRKLMDSAKKRPDDFKSMHGLLQIKAALELPFAPSVKPVFKQMAEAVYNPENNKFNNFILNFKNFGKEAEKIQVKLVSLTEGIAFENGDFQLKPLRTGEITSIKLPAAILDKMASSKFRFEVHVSVDGNNSHYTHEVSVAKALYQTSKKEIIPFQFADENRKHSLITFRREFKENVENKINQSERSTHSNLRTVEELYATGKSSYYLTFADPETPNRKELFFFELRDGKLVERENSLVLEDTVKVESVQKLDYNYDGTDDYLVKSIKVVDNQNLDIQHRYLNANLEPLYENMPVIHQFYSKGDAAVTSKTVRHVKTPVGKGQYLATPVYINEGKVTEQDQIVDHWRHKDQSVMRRIYRLELIPGEAPQYRYRTFMNQKFIQGVRNQFGHLIPPAVSLADTGVEVIGLRFQDQDDFKKGVVKGIISFGLGFQRFAIEVEFTFDGKKFRHLERVESQLVGNALHSVKDLESNKSFSVNAFVGFLTNSTVNIAHLDKAGERSFVYRLDTPYDRLMSFIASYQKEDKIYAFFETIDDILMVVNGESGKRESRLSTTKFSFLPGKMMSDIFYPISLRKEGDLNPAIYIDATAVSGNRVYAMTSIEDQLAAPVSLSVDLPSTCGYEDGYCGLARSENHFGTLYCVPMTPSQDVDGSYSYMILCKNKSEYEIIKVDLSL